MAKAGRPPRLLLIQLRQIGDVLMTTPAIRALRQAYPQAHLAFLTQAPADQVLRQNPYLNEVLLYPKHPRFPEKWAIIQQIHAHGFDGVIDFFGNPTSAWLTYLSGAHVRVGFAFRGRQWFYNVRVPFEASPQYAVMHKLALVQALGAQPDSLKLDFFITEADRQYAQGLLHGMGVQSHDFLVSLSPVSRQPYKVWPAGHFAQLADLLIERYGAKVLFVYGPKEEPFVEAVRSAMKQQALPNYEPPTLAQTKALFEQVHLHLGNDNGPCHFAVAAGIPTVAVFGRPKALNWTPPGQQKHLAVEYDPGCKNHCTYGRWWKPCEHLHCINRVPVEEVKQAVFQHIREWQLRPHDL